MTIANDEVEIPIEFGDLPPIEPPSATRQRKPKSQSKPRARTSNITQLQSALEKQFFLLGTLLSGFDTYDGQVIVDKAAPMAEALIEVAKTSPAVRSFLEKMIATGAWSAVITVIGGEVLLPIAVHHRMLPGQINDVLALGLDIPYNDKKDTNGNQQDNPENVYNFNGQGQDATGYPSNQDQDNPQDNPQG